MKKKIFFENLDGLRFFAFFSVFLFHSFYTSYDYIKENTTYKFVRHIFSNGDLGVNFFFVLSGFLITYLLLNEKQINGRINVKFFYIRRILRIWPLYFACVIFGFLIFPLIKMLFGQTPGETANIYYFISFLSNFNNIKYGMPDASVLGVLWSVAIEEQFYLCWPLLLHLFPTKHYAKLFISIIIGSVIYRSFNYDNYSLITFHTFSVISDMSVGGLTAYLIFNYKWFSEKVERFSRTTIIMAYIIGFAMILFRKDIFSFPILIITERIFLSFFFAFIILEQNYSNASFFKVGKSRILTTWGKYTYGLYCLHFIGILIAITISRVLKTNDSIIGVLLWETVLAFSFTILISWFSYTYFEKYFLKLKNKFAFIVKE